MSGITNWCVDPFLSKAQDPSSSIGPSAVNNLFYPCCCHSLPLSQCISRVSSFLHRRFLLKSIGCSVEEMKRSLNVE